MWENLSQGRALIQYIYLRETRNVSECAPQAENSVLMTRIGLFDAVRR